MIGLARHIEYLLLHNDRVSLPGVGMFAVLYRQAQLMPDGSSFLPPMRHIEFRPGETGDDELLLRSVMRAEFMTRDEACEAIAVEVDAIRRAVEAGEAYRLGRLGCFVQADGQLSFRVDGTNFIEYPRLGFAPVEVTLLEEPEAENESPTVEETKAPEGFVKSDTPITITIPSEADQATNIATVNFANSPIPHTGGMGTMMFTVGGAAILAAAGVLFVVTRRRENR